MTPVLGKIMISSAQHTRAHKGNQASICRVLSLQRIFWFICSDKRESGYSGWGPTPPSQTPPTPAPALGKLLEGVEEHKGTARAGRVGGVGVSTLQPVA